MQAIDLTKDITYLPGVGQQRARLLKEQMQISTLQDLLTYYPSRHTDRSRLYSTYELSTDMPFVQLKGEILSFEEEGAGRKRRIIAHFTDGNGIVDLVWFNGINYVKNQYKLHTQYIVFGRPSVFGGRFNIAHPDIDPVEKLTLSAMGLQPYYSVPEKVKKRGIYSRKIEQLTSTLLRMLDTPLPETLPPYLVKELQLMSYDEAIRTMHYPKDSPSLTQATYRLKFEELFYIQLSILRYTQERRRRFAGHLFRKVGKLFNTFYDKQLPFPLTEAQKRVIREMHADMRSGRQMNRLLQGDVGSGKTLVALMTMLIALDNGYQACIMAPTEILAEQHLATFRQFLGDLPVRVELLTSMVKGKKRKEVLEGLQSGEVNILVGTHAVIEENVQFARLGFVVIDEQHRFGVAQRAKLWRKNDTPPHVLVMTATPIPRTLAMTVYGDLDVSVIDELPPGRKPIVTLHHFEEKAEDLYEGMRIQMAQGRQIYVVFPLIKESVKIELKRLEDGYERLCHGFADVRIGKVQGKMKASEKDDEMARFVAGETRILIATTVIEVGVNVPNATMMVIENAERFGMAQLHQLRDPMGRGGDQSYYELDTSYKLTKEMQRRVLIMTETGDGFEIAEEDMRLRGPGDLEGTQQSGIAFDLKVANLARDGQVVQQARDVAKRILDADKDYSLPENQILWQHLASLRRLLLDWSDIS